jgi:hypothetical protein
MSIAAHIAGTPLVAMKQTVAAVIRTASDGRTPSGENNIFR